MTATMTSNSMPLDLAFTATGHGRPLVIMHGLFGWKRNWGAISKALSAHHHVFCVDLRNHGESPWSDDMTYPAMAEDIAKFIKRHCGGKADIIGHSMGGKAAMMTALLHPQMVNRLCVVDIAPTPSPGGFRDYADIMLSAPTGPEGNRSIVDKHIASVVPEPGVRAFLLQNLNKTEAGLVWRPNIPVIRDHMDDIMDFPVSSHGRSYGGSTLFIAGADSDYIQPQHHGAIEAFFPHHDLDIISGAGHWVHAEQSALFIKKTLAFFA